MVQLCRRHQDLDEAAQLLAEFDDGSIRDKDRPAVPEIIESLTEIAMQMRAAVGQT